jgi:hypothetical protein
MIKIAFDLDTARHVKEGDYLDPAEFGNGVLPESVVVAVEWGDMGMPIVHVKFRDRAHATEWLRREGNNQDDVEWFLKPRRPYRTALSLPRK